MTCSELADQTEGMVIANAMGGQFEILKVGTSELISRSDSELVCKGNAKFASGLDDGPIRMIYYQDGDGEWWIEVRTVN